MAVGRRAFTAAVALLALAALQGQGRAVADGASGASGARAVWRLQGKPLPGAASSADAPAMTPAVTYRDAIKPGETKFYGVVLDARSSAYLSAFAVPAADSQVAYGDGLDLKLLSADGSYCDSQDAHFQDDGDARPIGTAVTRLIGVGSSCQNANQYVLQVHRTSDATSDPGTWPLELRYVAEPPASAVGVGPAPTAGTASPTPLTEGSPQRAHGGTGFETAPTVKTGIWRDDLLPGETRFYKVPVDWGQRATVFADFSSARITGSTFIGSGARLAVFSPVRELIDGRDTSYQGSPASIGEQLAPVSYANRAAGDVRVARVRYAGWYYLAVTVHPNVAKVVSGAVPVTLRIDVSGAAQAGPTYEGDAAAAGIGVQAQDVAVAKGAAKGAASSGGVPSGVSSAVSSGGASSSSGALRFVAFAALGAGTVLLLALAGWYGMARRRPGWGAADAVPPRDR
jgi:hypothetical protein